MAWFLRCNGVSEYLATSPHANVAGSTFRIKFKFAGVPATPTYLALLGESAGNKYVRINETGQCRASGTALGSSAALAPTINIFDGAVHEYSCVYGATNHQHFVDGSSTILLSANTTWTSWDWLCRSSYGYANIDVYEIEWSNNAGENHFWSADASDHSNTGVQPVLVDIVGTNNAVGVGFPTDGSAWGNDAPPAGFQVAWAINANTLIQ